MPHDEAHAEAHDDTHEFWEQFYAEREQVWSGRPNVVLVEEIEGLAPGTALDLGCGEGADAIWLASRGWQVVAADISQAALDRAAAHAAAAGVGDRITLGAPRLLAVDPRGPVRPGVGALPALTGRRSP